MTIFRQRYFTCTRSTQPHARDERIRRRHTARERNIVVSSSARQPIRNETTRDRWKIIHFEMPTNDDAVSTRYIKKMTRTNSAISAQLFQKPSSVSKIILHALLQDLGHSYSRR